MNKYMATIVQSGLCKTNTAIPRPNPALFFYPGLSTRPIYESRQFEVADMLRSNTAAIVDEYTQWYSHPHTKSDYKLVTDEHKLHEGHWEWNSYILKGRKQSEFAVRCPQTTSTLESIPSLMHSVPFSYAFFSTLKPHSQIAAHYGPCNIRVRCHLPLVVPTGECGMSVGVSIVDISGMYIYHICLLGRQEVKWEVGEPLFFDDCYEHFVWNKTKSDRVVLLFDMW